MLRAEMNYSTSETDAERLKHAPGRAFEWVSRELVLPNEESRESFKSAFLSAAHGGHEKVLSVLERAWPEGARWPSGEDYLRSIGWRAPDDFSDDDEVEAHAEEYDGPELIELLYQRLIHVCSRVYRDQQVCSLIDPRSPHRNPKYTHALLNRDGDFLGNPCGCGVDKVISIDDALKLMEQPAHANPACNCTVGPFPVTSADRLRLSKE